MPKIGGLAWCETYQAGRLGFIRQIIRRDLGGAEPEITEPDDYLTGTTFGAVISRFARSQAPLGNAACRSSASRVRLDASSIVAFRSAKVALLSRSERRQYATTRMSAVTARQILPRWRFGLLCWSQRNAIEAELRYGAFPSGAWERGNPASLGFRGSLVTLRTSARARGPTRRGRAQWRRRCGLRRAAGASGRT